MGRGPAMAQVLGTAITKLVDHDKQSSEAAEVVRRVKDRELRHSIMSQQAVLHYADAGAAAGPSALHLDICTPTDPAARLQ